MTIKEIIELQDSTGHLYLLRQRLFYRGYNQAAAFLSDAFGYRLLSKEVKSCGKKLFYVGSPAIAKNKVIESKSPVMPTGVETSNELRVQNAV